MGVGGEAPIDENGGRSHPNEEYVIRLNVLQSVATRSNVCDYFCDFFVMDRSKYSYEYSHENGDLNQTFEKEIILRIF